MKADSSSFTGLQFMRQAEDEILRRAAEKRKLQNNTVPSNASCFGPPLPLISFKSISGNNDVEDIPQTIMGINCHY